ncbi:19174_t:CDS:2, partial [Racocetra fulgida]
MKKENQVVIEYVISELRDSWPSVGSGFECILSDLCSENSEGNIIFLGFVSSSIFLGFESSESVGTLPGSESSGLLSSGSSFLPSSKSSEFNVAAPAFDHENINKNAVQHAVDAYSKQHSFAAIKLYKDLDLVDKSIIRHCDY